MQRVRTCRQGVKRNIVQRCICNVTALGGSGMKLLRQIIAGLALIGGAAFAAPAGGRARAEVVVAELEAA